jgi:hypothetical protein
MKGTLHGKPTHVKKWRGRWLIVRYNRTVIPEDMMQKVWGYAYY